MRAERELTRMMGLKTGDTAAIVGCGGKTGLMLRLARENRDASVLIGTTTRIYRPPPDCYDREVTSPEAAARGITLAHGGQAGSKLMPAPLNVLDGARSGYDYTFIEPDGSRGLPLKGWRDDEPVVPDFVNVTIGVAAVWPVGRPLSEETALRLDRFCALTGAVSGEPVAPGHIAAMIAASDGMFRAARGRRVLFLNGIESDDARKQALAVLELLPGEFLSGLSRVVAGSLYMGSFETLREGAHG